MWKLALLWGVTIACIVALADTHNLGPLIWLVSLVPYGDKVCHFLLMGGFCACTVLALGWSGERSPRRALMWGTAAVSAVVVIEEISQRWIEGRTFDLIDLAADFGGILVASWAAHWILRRRRDAGAAAGIPLAASARL